MRFDAEKIDPALEAEAKKRLSPEALRRVGWRLANSIVLFCLAALIVPEIALYNTIYSRRAYAEPCGA
jgi:hypothetical protein